MPEDLILQAHPKAEVVHYLQSRKDIKRIKKILGPKDIEEFWTFPFVIHINGRLPKDIKNKDLPEALFKLFSPKFKKAKWKKLDISSYALSSNKNFIAIVCFDKVIMNVHRRTNKHIFFSATWTIFCVADSSTRQVEHEVGTPASFYDDDEEIFEEIYIDDTIDLQ